MTDETLRALREIKSLVHSGDHAAASLKADGLGKALVHRMDEREISFVVRFLDELGVSHRLHSPLETIH